MLALLCIESVNTIIQTQEGHHLAVMAILQSGRTFHILQPRTSAFMAYDALGKRASRNGFDIRTPRPAELKSECWNRTTSATLTAKQSFLKVRAILPTPRHAQYEVPMRVALCISGDFMPSSKAIQSACDRLLPTETVDVFAFFWTTPEVDEPTIRNWFNQQLNPRITLRRWAFEPIREFSDWAKFSGQHPKYSANYFQELSRAQWAAQAVSQLKAQQESSDGRDYDAVVHMNPHITITAAPPLSLFTTLLDDHIILGRFAPMTWFPAHDIGVVAASSRNMEIFSSIQTMHRRHYLMRYGVVDFGVALAHHFQHLRLKVCSVIMRNAP
jgi:hypothetical protein